MIDSQQDLIFLGRIALAGLLAFMIGWEREAQGSAAGDRTHALVGVAAAAFASIGVEKFPADAGRIIQGVVTGVGFLGAGMILKEAQGRVTGLTTAAGIWAVASVGIMIGTGEYIMGVSLTVLILFILGIEKVPLVGRLSYSSDRKRSKRNQSDI